MSRSRRHRASSNSLQALLSRITTQWRNEVKLLRRLGADQQAATLESKVVELEDATRTYSEESLTLGQAEAESGYSYSAIEKMVRQGTIPNVGKKGSPRVRRGDLPKKPGRACGSSEDEPDLADMVLT